MVEPITDAEVGTLRGYAGGWLSLNPSYIKKIIARIEADAQTIAAKDAEIERLKKALEETVNGWCGLTGYLDPDYITDLRAVLSTQEGDKS